MSSELSNSPGPGGVPSGPDRTAEETASMRVHRESETAASAAAVPSGIMLEKPGDFVGPYKLMSVLGEGGFGTVWLAERREPMVQRVALKIIKPGMDSKSVIARFEQERQALAVMDHPNVARVFDGGVTEKGRPYFVMEYVHGEPITAFADRLRMTLRQRLELFVPVCEAVQHAHTKGIIHRDLKPSNILVEEIDGSPLVKVIDFGIAKAITQAEWAQSAFTQEGAVIGTPEYMSPEQVSGLADVDTRSDVYALGVVLYELLTGELPFDSRLLRRAALVEIQRVIREVTPPKPSTRLMQIAQERTTQIVKGRSTTRERLTAELRRELDWIPLMAIRKERDRRYASAGALAEDVRRYLDGFPLIAAPDSRVYLMRKFVRRNRVQVFAGAAVFLTLGVGLAAAIWQGNEAATQRDEAVLAGEREAKERARADERADAAERAERAAEAARDAESERAEQLQKVSDFQSRMLAQIDTTKAGVDLMADVRERFVAALEKAGASEEERTARVDALRQELVRVNATDAAAAMIDRTILRPAVETIDREFKDQPRVDAQLRQSLADLYRTIGLYEAAYSLQETVLSILRQERGEQHSDTFACLNNMGYLLQELGRLSEADAYTRQAMEGLRREHGSEHPSTLSAIDNMGRLLLSQGKSLEAETFFVEALDTRRRVLGEEHPSTVNSIHNVGSLLLDQGRAADAEPYFREALGKKRRALGDDHPKVLSGLDGFGALLQAQGRFDEAEPYLRDALVRRRRVLGEEHPDTLASVSRLGGNLWSQGELDAAEPYFREALDKHRRMLGEGHPNTLAFINNMGVLLYSLGRLSDAEPYFLEALEKHRQMLGDEHPNTMGFVNNLGNLLVAQGKPAEAEPYYREAMEKYRRVLGEEHPHTLISIHNMGGLLRQQGDLGEAEPYYREALEKSRRVLGNEHPYTLAFISNIGVLFRQQDRHQEAIELLTPAESAARKQFAGGNVSRLGGFLLTLGRARVGAGYEAERFALAEANLLEAHAIYVEARGEAHKETLECVAGLVELYDSWHAAEPEKGYDAKASAWRAKLDAAGSGAESR